ncbi:MAG: glycerophosphodiester phosphodiesterase [Myxococcales bacterium]|nr:glycerophosphodiester phosphodiesterase [Myxococcales bacterium]
MTALPTAFRRRAGRPAIVGHRGVRSLAGASSGPFVENTLGAIEEAARQGADAVEIDVRACLSGEIVVFHDPDLARLANDPREVARVGWPSLRGLDLGGGRIPLLEDVLALVSDLGLGLNVEIKHDLPDRKAVVGPVAKLLAPRAGSIDLVVSSFDPTTLSLFRFAAPRIAAAQLIHESTYHDWAFRVARALGTAVHVESTLAVRARCQPFLGDPSHRRFVNVWTVNDPGEARRLFDLGVDALITDVPGRLRAAFQG